MQKTIPRQTVIVEEEEYTAYFCDICDDMLHDWTPCVCCGRDVCDDCGICYNWNKTLCYECFEKVGRDLYEIEAEKEKEIAILQSHLQILKQQHCTDVLERIKVEKNQKRKDNSCS